MFIDRFYRNIMNNITRICNINIVLDIRSIHVGDTSNCNNYAEKIVTIEQT